MKRISLLVCVLMVSSCSFWGQSPRKPAQVDGSSLDLVSISQGIVEKVATREFNTQNCLVEMDALISDYEKAPSNLNLETVKKSGKVILDQSFEARMALHSMLDVLPNACKVRMKDLYLSMRVVEDLVGIYYYDNPQISADSLKYANEPTPVYDALKYNPYRGIEGELGKKFEFKNGDIMITKGISFVSSTISELAAPKSLFSHIVFVHVDEKTKVVTTIESYVGKGVSIFPIEEALRNENARILVLRAKDSQLASKAANYMYEKVLKLKAKKKFIPYDYNLDFSDNSKLSCEEVAYDSFKTLSQGQFILPENESSILLDDAKFLSRIGIKKGGMMVPADMETDSRFDIVLDWTDHRVLRDSWRKDEVLGAMFRWIQDHHYKIHENLTSVAAKVIWSTRSIPGLWPMMAKLAGIPKDFTKDVPGITISTIASLKTIGNDLLTVIAKKDQAQFEKSGRWMTKEELGRALDLYRESDPKSLRKVFRK